MATISERLQALAGTLTAQYGNTITLVDKSAEGWYDPQTGERHQNTVTYVKYGAIKAITTEDIKIANMPDKVLDKVSKVITLAVDNDISTINNSWTVDGMAIHKIIKVTAQNNDIMIKLFVG